MKQENHLGTELDELYEDLLTKIMSDPLNGKALLEESKASARYDEDFIFRAIIDTLQMLIWSLYGEVNKILTSNSELLERLTAFGLWKLVSMCWNLMGSAYLGIENLERAMECYRNVIKVESRYDLKTMTSIAYNNLAVIYIILEQFEKAYHYAQRAMDSLEELGKDQPRYESKKLKYLGELLITLCFTERVDEAAKKLEEMKELVRISPNQRAKYAYHYNRMVYQFHAKDFDGAKESYAEVRRQILEGDTNEELRSLISFVRLCQIFKLPPSFYVEELKEMEGAGDSDVPQRDGELYGLLKEYYEQIGDEEGYFRIGLKYIDAISRYQKELRDRQVDSLDLIDHLITNSESMDIMQSKNMELTRLADEAVRNKNALQEAYSRIEIINQLGKDVTSSLDLSKVIDQIYQNLVANMPITVFMLMVVERNEEQLRSIAYYHGDVLQPEFTISLDNTNSMLIECMNTRKIIFSDDLDKDERFKERRFVRLGEGRLVQSVAFMPLEVGDDVIGVCSIQDIEKKAYTQKHIEFLEELLPYLSIALNNAIRSQSLEQEIKLHLETQEELKAAYRRLEEISSIDGLTGIDNRRTFGLKLDEMMTEAQYKGRSISIFMMDIDNFKTYNDTYGHLEGDEVLRTIAAVVRKHFERSKGIAGRFGGEEFVGACIGNDPQESMELAERIRSEVFELAIENESAPLKRISISIGICFVEEPGELQKSQIARLADEALYRAKKNGRNKTILEILEYGS
ncbi:MAG: diguanylate cyclase [Peptostreptococcaceae bacterium]|nr:diguanylate cyclase [Peptostreptococcaceae bacterium]